MNASSMMKGALSAFLLLLTIPAYSQEATPLSEEEQYQAWAQSIIDSLDRKTGTVDISQASATLEVPENFYFLSAEDARTVLVDVWGNPPNNDVLGMLFPADYTPFDAESWAVTVEYVEDGYVSDEDANDIDYNELLETMRSDTREESKERVKQGYDAVELVGWAAPPYYDAKEKKLHWAKEIKFGESDINTLNYNIRVLGRKGVLILNFIAGMEQKTIIDDNVDAVLAMAEFDQGSTYAEFNPELDDVAAYGLGALVAGKVIAKTGFFAMALLFLKKFGVFIVVGLGALAKKLFSRKKQEA